MLKSIQICAFLILSFFGVQAQQMVTISGFLKEKSTKELLIGVNVYIPNTNIGVSTNTYGYYSLSVPAKDSLTLVYSMVGFQKKTLRLPFTKNQKLDIELEDENFLEEVVISSKTEQNKQSNSPNMSKIDLPVDQIKNLPTLMGEKDVLKIIQLLPGVQKASEGQSGIYVRGGGPDQNLIILDDAVVYNASHLFGFFSTFNGDALKSVELTKGGFPARYGGRLSSVIDLTMKDGNKEKFSGEGGIGLISSRLLLEGPLKFNKNKPAKGSFLVSGRRTYVDFVMRPFIKAQNEESEGKQTSGYYFYDLNVKLNYEINSKNKIFLSSYLGDDVFYNKYSSPTDNSDAGLNWGNITTTLRWNHVFGQKTFGNASLIYSNYGFNIFTKETRVNSLEANNFTLNYNSGIEDYSLKYDIDYFQKPNLSFRFGVMATHHTFTPEALILQNASSEVNLTNDKSYKVWENAVYTESVWSPIPKIKVNAGLRLSQYLITNAPQHRLEPRISLAYKVKNDLAIKASYATMNQYLHLLTNTGLGLPTDLWVPATEKVAPQSSSQIAAGAVKDIDQTKGISITLEGYYKKMNNIISYKEGASFLSINANTNIEENGWENKVTSGQGESYGLEFLLQKKVGKFSGWVGYTWSKTLWTFQELNFGKSFFPKYDRRHDLSLVGIYKLKPKITLSGIWVYGTGNALTIPIAEYRAYSSNFVRGDNVDNPIGWRNFTVQEYGERNSFRAEPYHRLDLGIQFHKKKKRFERTWDVSIYNAYNRKNPFFYTASNDQTFFGSSANTNTSNTLTLKRYSLFPILPSITYNFKF
ncbi:TonB-dependent receptor [Lacihabitans soyangensis]|uniref:TonB-dependent receptor n=1 Tax=Lacihabitans soyangensis TaxID=869394 RepID=A0AAE3KVL6_9BACT|nr:TonB-dependent receptor [Lacihabitans soyangensis]MCP9761365.1 TonB-dependent receptor [Lacihabitans soyangensis]